MFWHSIWQSFWHYIWPFLWHSLRSLGRSSGPGALHCILSSVYRDRPVHWIPGQSWQEKAKRRRRWGQGAETLTWQVGKSSMYGVSAPTIVPKSPTHSGEYKIDIPKYYSNNSKLKMELKGRNKRTHIPLEFLDDPVGKVVKNGGWIVPTLH